MGQTNSVNDIRTAIRELTARADLARKKDGRRMPTRLEARIAAKRARSSASARSTTRP